MCKKVILLSLIVLTLMALSQNAKAADAALYFCVSVDSKWMPVGASDQFEVEHTNGGIIVMLVRLPYGVGCSKVRFEIHKKVKPEDDPEYLDTVTLVTKSSWKIFKQDYTFYDPGEYTVNVIDSYNNLLVSGTVKITCSYGYRKQMSAYKP